MVRVEGQTLTVMGPKRPGDQKQTGTEQNGFRDVVSHDTKIVRRTVFDVNRTYIQES
jgi:hypothetical protein